MRAPRVLVFAAAAVATGTEGHRRLAAPGGGDEQCADVFDAYFRCSGQNEGGGRSAYQRHSSTRAAAGSAQEGGRGSNSEPDLSRCAARRRRPRIIRARALKTDIGTGDDGASGGRDDDDGNWDALCAVTR